MMYILLVFQANLTGVGGSYNQSEGITKFNSALAEELPAVWKLAGDLFGLACRGTVRVLI